MVRFHISAKKNPKLTCWTPLAANRKPNRMGIRMEIRTCRQPLTLSLSLSLSLSLPSRTMNLTWAPQLLRGRVALEKNSPKKLDQI
jgi:hypothetical protein